LGHARGWSAAQWQNVHDGVGLCAFGRAA